MKKIGFKAVILGVGVLAVSASMAHSKTGIITSAQSRTIPVVNTGVNTEWSRTPSGFANQCPGHPGDNGIGCPVSFQSMVAKPGAAKVAFSRASYPSAGGF